MISCDIREIDAWQNWVRPRSSVVEREIPALSVFPQGHPFNPGRGQLVFV
jgi:hypothetical protein